MWVSLRAFFTIIFVLPLAVPLALAQQRTAVKVLPEQASLSASANACELGTASVDLDVGGVRARLYNTGGLFWNGGDGVYEVPRGSGINSMFAAGIWLGGEVDGELRFAGADYGNWEWWPGPLDADGNPPADCAAFDRIYLVTQQPDGSLSDDVADWPADLGAPFEDTDGDGVYEPGAGETPTVYGHQTAFWVMNDRGGEHWWSDAEPLGLTVRVTAFTFNSDDPALGFGTFYRYEFENPNAYTIENARLGLWADPDLGYFNDDYVGSDPARGMGFVYNGDSYDGDLRVRPDEYGFQPPALGIDFLSGAEGALYYENSTEPNGNPTGGEDAYAYLNLRFLDGTPMTVGGVGYNPDDPTAPETNWMWPGAPEDLAFWSEFNTDGMGSQRTPSDRRLLSVAEPFVLGPGETHTVDLALLWGQGRTFLESVVELRSHSDQVQAAYNNGTLFDDAGPMTGPPSGPPPPPPIPDLDTPTPTFPADGTDLADVVLSRTNPDCTADDPDRDCIEVTLTWEPVPGAIYYDVQISDGTGFEELPVVTRLENTTLSRAFSDNTIETIQWRVRAGAQGALSNFSGVQTYRTRFNYVPAIRDAGAGIVEIDYAGTPTCDGVPVPPACDLYGGSAVWLAPNPTEDYYITSWQGGTVERLEWRIDVAAPHDYEIRFTDACASGACYGINYLLRGQGEVVRVPFELWQVGIGTFDDPSDDVRLIPMLLRPTSAPSIEAWRFAIGSNSGNGDGVESSADFEALTSDAIYWMYPDRPDGYAQLAAAAPSVGLGNVFEGFDTQTDLDPRTGEACARQGFFVDFCHRNDLLPPDEGNADFVSLISRFQFADQAGDGTPPPTGTTLRVLTTKATPPVMVEPEEPEGALPETITLDVFPNPARGQVTIEYGQVGRTGATLDVYDTLGRLIARLDEGVREPGTYEATLDVRALSGGVYFVVFRSVNARKVFPISVVR
ncbi:MAG: T9SS type A sorting domain-containing protein [Bacteroidota bacterium]